MAKIGWLSPRSAASATRLDEFRQELRKLGYVEGKNIVIESRYAEENLERLPALADELVRLKVDVLFTRGTPESVALKKATNTIPIVFYSVTDPVGAGLVESLARPGGNITGFSSIESVLAGKRLELLKETVPKLVRVSVGRADSALKLLAELVQIRSMCWSSGGGKLRSAQGSKPPKRFRLSS